MNLILRRNILLLGLLCLILNIYCSIHLSANEAEKGKNTVSGYVKDENGEELIGATVYIEDLKSGTVSNLYGYYSLSLLPGSYKIAVSYIGYAQQTQNIDLNQNLKIDFNLQPMSEEIESVEISAKRINKNVVSVEMSTVELQMKTIKKLPAFLGEVDVIKSIQLLPGVQTGGEGTTGFYVRGGSVDQNLILLDGAPVYNPSHAGGIFSVFNGDAIKNVELFKGGIPAEYGGRLSSVLDVRMKEGNPSKYKAYGGIGTISSKLTIEGPIVKDKGSFIVSGRRTYADLFLIFSKNEAMKKSSLFFYDLNAKANYRLNDNNRIFLSGYFGRDVFEFSDIFNTDWGNQTFTLRWNHIFNNKVFSNVTLIGAKFDYGFGFPSGSTAFDWNANIKSYGLKNDYTWFANTNNNVKFGIQTTFMDFKPGEAKKMDGSFFDIPGLPNSYCIEHGIYIHNEQKISRSLSIKYGLRASLFQNIGKATIYNFVEEYNPYDSSTVMVPIDSSVFRSGEIFKNHPIGWEPRVSMRYTINDLNSIKASYNRMYQYIHLASNTAAVTPFDMWFPSNPNIKPQKADQIALGYFRNLFEHKVEASVEGYYKKIYNAVDFRDFAELFLNKYFDGEIRSGEAYSYGLEFLAKKETGDLTGWISYTLSRTRRKIPDVNGGKEYFAPYDKTHDFSIIMSYDINERLNISSTWVYSTAMPITVPVGVMDYYGQNVPIWSYKNSTRVPGTDYHRMDLSITLNNKQYKKNGDKKKNTGSWNISVYNLYSQKNTYSVNFQESDENPDLMVAKKLYLFKILPSITYNFNF